MKGGNEQPANIQPTEYRQKELVLKYPEQESPASLQRAKQATSTQFHNLVELQCGVVGMWTFII